MRIPLFPALLPLLLPATAPADTGAAPEPRAGGGYVLKYWETDDGLPNNVVDAVVKRSDGFLWIGTLSGAVRFDGVDFAPLRPPVAGAARSTVVRSLAEENPRSLLVAGNGPELWRLTGGQLAAHPAAAHFRPDQKIARLFREADDIFWIAFDNREVWRSDHGSIERFPAVPPRTLGETHFARDAANNVYLSRGAGVERYRAGALEPCGAEASLPALGSSDTGGAWMAISNRIYRLDGDRWLPVAGELPWPAASRPSILYEAHDGSLWVALAEGGVWRWKAGQCEAMEVSFPKVRDICEDDEGDIWLATAGGGLDRLQPTRFSLVARQPGVVAGVFGSVCEDSLGNVWFAQTTAVTRLPVNGTVPIAAPASWPRSAMPLCPDRAGRLWMAVDNQLWLSPPGRPENPALVDDSNPAAIRVLFAARDGRVWVGRERGPLENYREGRREAFGPEQGFPASSFVQAIAQDSTGQIWTGTTDGSLYALSAGRFVHYSVSDGLPGSSIRAIHGDGEGALWVATAGGGLVVRLDGRFVRLDKAQGLPDDTLYQMLEDDHGFLWFGSPRWLFRIRKQDLRDCAQGRQTAVTPEIYGRSDGLSGFTAVDGYQPDAWKTAKGRLWFATRKGLVSTDPLEHPADRRPPRVWIDRFAVGGRPILGAHPRLKASDDKYEFVFTSPAYASPKDVRFRYRLSGLESDWSEPTAQRVVIYPALAPGRYEFSVAARDGNGAWNPVATDEGFEVLPLWWETWWARAAGAGLAATALGILVRYGSHRRLKARLERLELSQRVEAERARIARDLHDSLGAGLTRISMIAEEMYEDTETLEKMKIQSGRLMERVRTVAGDLEGAVWTVSPQYDNLSSLCAYLGQFCLEYFRASGTRCRVDFGDAIPPVPVPPDIRHHLVMIVTELVNNVVKHAKAGQVDLTMRLQADAFDLVLADNGRGFDPEAAETAGRSGLRNLRARAAEIGGRVEIKSSVRGGTAVRITVPIRGEGAPPRA